MSPLAAGVAHFLRRLSSQFQHHEIFVAMKRLVPFSFRAFSSSIHQHRWKHLVELARRPAAASPVAAKEALLFALSTHLDDQALPHAWNILHAHRDNPQTLRFLVHDVEGPVGLLHRFLNKSLPKGTHRSLQRYGRRSSSSPASLEPALKIHALTQSIYDNNDDFPDIQLDAAGLESQFGLWSHQIQYLAQHHHHNAPPDWGDLSTVEQGLQHMRAHLSPDSPARLHGIYLKALGQAQRADEAYEHLQLLKQQQPATTYSDENWANFYSSVLLACRGQRGGKHSPHAERVFAEIQHHRSLAVAYSPFLYNIYMNLWASAGDAPRTWQLLEQLRKASHDHDPVAPPNLLHYNVCLKACARSHRDGPRACDILRHMVARGLAPDRISYTSAMEAWIASEPDWSKVNDWLDEMEGSAPSLHPDTMLFRKLVVAATMRCGKEMEGQVRTKLCQILQEWLWRWKDRAQTHPKQVEPPKIQDYN